MPSPFPGMNPYFESPDIWEDFHQSLAAEIRDQLIPQLRPQYYAALVPLLPVPLREPDPDIPLDLTQAIQNSYDRAGYDMRGDYTKPLPKPDFSEGDVAWVKTIAATVP